MAARLSLDWYVERGAEGRGFVLIKPFWRRIAIFDPLRRRPVPNATQVVQRK